MLGTIVAYTFTSLVAYLAVGYVLLCGCRFFGVHPFAFEDWDAPIDDDPVLNGFLVLWWPFFVLMWPIKLFLYSVWLPTAGFCWLIGIAITRCRICKRRL